MIHMYGIFHTKHQTKPLRASWTPKFESSMWFDVSYNLVMPPTPTTEVKVADNKSYSLKEWAALTIRSSTSQRGADKELCVVIRPPARLPPTRPPAQHSPPPSLTLL